MLMKKITRHIKATQIEVAHWLGVNLRVALLIVSGIRNWHAPFLYRLGIKSLERITLNDGDTLVMDGKLITLSHLQWILRMKKDVPRSTISYSGDGRLMISLEEEQLKFIADEFTLETTLKTVDEQFGQDLYRVKNARLEGKTVVDIGANIGDSAILFASKGANVYAFEPVPRSYRTLTENVVLNNFGDKIISFNVGLGMEERMAEMGISPDALIGFSLHQIAPSRPTAYETIRIVEAVSFMQENGITSCDLLKIDCEGCENELLRDLSLLAYLKPEKAIVEWHFGNRAGVVEKLRSFYSEVEAVSITKKGANGLVYAQRPLS